ncbi:hypothetical protein [Streptomyces sp. SID1034]|uniref:hypothetical protein n=1 Tax=Streptomyces TaxID=1883 RepID=UPI00136E381B|nr:hypothetical protein [Streptomyces sp. SID1034]MYV94904.1 hypothetical protein [Streptomyces sp. SID1034]
MSDDKHREELCPACLAFPGEHDVRVIVARADGTTLQTWHKEDCPIDRKAEGERR